MEDSSDTTDEGSSTTEDIPIYELRLVKGVVITVSIIAVTAILVFLIMFIVGIGDKL